MAKKDTTIATLEKGKKAVFTTSANIHEGLLNTSSLVIEETIANLTKAQKITAKAIKKSEPIVDKQIDIIFDTAEAVKNQAVKGGKRALKLFGMTKTFNKLSKTITNVVNDIPTTDEIVDSTKHYVESAKKDVEKAIEKASATVKRATDSIEDAQKVASKKVSGAKKATAGKRAKAVKTVSKAAPKAKAAVKKASQSVAKAKASTKRISATTKKVAAKTVKAKPVTKTATKKVVAKKVAAKKVVAKKTAPKKISKVVTPTFETVKIKGIGASLSQKMADNGIKTIADLQNASVEVLNKVKVQAGNRYASYDATKWIEAAKAVNAAK